jgi:hypothetical protein
MERHDLRESWAVTLRHLAAARFYLPEHLPMGEVRDTERELAHYLYHNEFGLALGEADALGELCSAPAAYWRELQLAAGSMGLDEEATRYAQRSES